MSKGAATITELARAVETLKRRDRETRARVAKLEAAPRLPSPFISDGFEGRITGFNFDGVMQALRDLPPFSPAAVTPPPAATPVRTTLGATLSQAWALLKARHSLTRALNFFTRNSSPLTPPKNEGQA